jgi:hypothetical protein
MANWFDFVKSDSENFAKIIQAGKSCPSWNVMDSAGLIPDGIRMPPDRRCSRGILILPPSRVWSPRNAGDAGPHFAKGLR